MTLPLSQNAVSIVVSSPQDSVPPEPNDSSCDLGTTSTPYSVQVAQADLPVFVGDVAYPPSTNVEALVPRDSSHYTQRLLPALLFSLPRYYYFSCTTSPSLSTLHEFVREVTKLWLALTPAVSFCLTATLGLLLYTSHSIFPAIFLQLAFGCFATSLIDVIGLSLLLNAILSGGGEAWLNHARHAPEHSCDPWVFLSLPVATFLWGLVFFGFGVLLMIVINGGVGFPSSQSIVLFGRPLFPRLLAVLTVLFGVASLVTI